MKVFATVGSILTGLVLSSAVILLPVQGAIADNAAPKAAPKAAAKAPAKKHMKKAMKKHHAPSAEWKKVQNALIAKGAKIKADGYPGRATKKAILDFQKKNKLKTTGKLDPATKKALGI